MRVVYACTCASILFSPRGLVTFFARLGHDVVITKSYLVVISVYQTIGVYYLFSIVVVSDTNKARYEHLRFNHASCHD